jgi:hypothetical protein
MSSSSPTHNSLTLIRTLHAPGLCRPWPSCILMHTSESRLHSYNVNWCPIRFCFLGTCSMGGENGQRQRVRPEKARVLISGGINTETRSGWRNITGLEECFCSHGCREDINGQVNVVGDLSLSSRETMTLGLVWASGSRFDADSTLTLGREIVWTWLGISPSCH